MKKKLLDKNGFSLSEVLVALQLMSLVIILAFSTFRIFQHSYLRQISELKNIHQESFDTYKKYYLLNREKTFLNNSNKK